MRVWMWPLPHTAPRCRLLQNSLEFVRNKLPLHLQPFEFLFAFLGPGFFLPLTQGELSRFRFPDGFMVISQQIRLTFLLAWTRNETQTLHEHIT